MKTKSLVVLFIWLLIGCIGFNLVYSQPSIQEAFRAGSSWKAGNGLPDYGASLDWTMENGLPNNWKQAKGWPSPPINRNEIKGTPVPLPNDELFLFQNNTTSPNCCGSYSTSDGCVCVSQEQIEYVNQRGEIWNKIQESCIEYKNAKRI